MEPQNRCRTCLKIEETSWNIFETKQNDKLISELIMDCASIEIRNGDKLPVNICDNCLQKLNSAWEFKEMVIKSDKILSKSNIDEKLNANGGEFVGDTDTTEMFIKQEIDPDVCIKTESDEQITLESRLDIPVSDQGEDEDDIAESEESDAALQGSPSDLKKIQINNKKNPINSTRLSEEQLKILDNPDFKRIMESDLSSRVKARKKVFCQVCNRTFTYKHYITVHAHIHIGNLPFKCELCDFRVPRKYLLQKHMSKHTPVTKNFPCDICGRAFAMKQTLNAHILRHTDEKPFKCKICGKAFKQPSDVQQHEAGHEDIKRFVCDECGKSFKHKRNLSDHKIVHTNERNFECSTCGKKFVLKKCLDMHAKKHLGLKPYSCDICGKKFTVKMTWQSHLWIHTGEKPFACEICGKNFRQRACITRHMRIHTGEAPYACKYCPEKFKYSQQLQNHEVKHEKKKEEDDSSD